jgi:hypothetical protein
LRTPQDGSNDVEDRREYAWECARRAVEAMEGVTDLDVRLDFWRLAIRYHRRDRGSAGAGGLEIADARFTAYSRGVDCRGLR